MIIELRDNTAVEISNDNFIVTIIDKAVSEKYEYLITITDSSNTIFYVLKN